MEIRCLAWICILPISALGKIGETPEQIAAVLGSGLEAVNSPANQTFKHRGFQVEVTFADGRSIREVISKEDATAFTPTEASTALTVYGAGLRWLINKEGLRWIRADGLVMAEKQTESPPQIVFIEASFSRLAENHGSIVTASNLTPQEIREAAGVTDALGFMPPPGEITPIPRPPSGDQWRTPRPPIPYQMRSLLHGPWTGLIRVSTDSVGPVIDAVMVVSTGNGILDGGAIEFVKNSWRGPPNAAKTFPVSYREE